MDQRSFIEAIQANPDDEVSRLVYADWLDEQGEPRGELIRVQCELARLPANDPRRKLLDQRESELLDDYGEDWLKPLRELGALGVSVRYFRKGLIEHLKIAAEDFLEHAETLCQIEPALSRVQLTNVSPHMNRLTAVRFPSQISTLDLSANPVEAEGFRLLAQAKFVGQLKELDLKFTRLGIEGLRGFCSQEWPQLERLDLSGNRIGPDGASVLTAQVCFPQLRILLLSMNRLGEEAGNLFRPHSWVNLEELHLASNGIPSAAAQQMISKCRHFPVLRILNLRYNRISQTMQKQLQESERPERLAELDLTGNYGENEY